MDFYLDERYNKYFIVETEGEDSKYYDTVVCIFTGYITHTHIYKDTNYGKKEHILYYSDLVKSNISKLSYNEIEEMLKRLYGKEINYGNKLISYLEDVKLNRLKKQKEEENKKHKQTIDVKLMEIDAINKNTEMQKYLAETVFGAMTYFAQMFKDKKVDD